VVAGHFPDFIEPVVLDGRDPDHQVVHNVPRELPKLLGRELRDLDPANHRMDDTPRRCTRQGGEDEVIGV